MKRGLVWFRRDLRLHDHVALSVASKVCDEVHAVFVFDTTILNHLKDKSDARLHFIIDSLKEMEEILNKHNSSIHVLYGDPTTLIPKFCREQNIHALFFNRDYEPQAKKRDESVIATLKQAKIEAHHFKDCVFFEAKEVLKNDGSPYKVFTPYMLRWREALRKQEDQVPQYPCNLKKMVTYKNDTSILEFDWFKKLGFSPSVPHLKAGMTAAKKQLDSFLTRIQDYEKLRDFPALEGTSNMSVYLRHGNISVREVVKAALTGTSIGHQKWLAELVWREFYLYILDQFPEVVNHAFKPSYDQIKWDQKPDLLEAWKNGETGFPIVDAAMRCLKATGTMPNRLRMVTASFLCKTLLLDWRLGEAWFAQKLLDFDLAANNGGWQWCASSGVDSQPYFRIFNPWSQSQKFDPAGDFIRSWCPELSLFDEKQIHHPHEATPLEQQMAGCLVGQDYPFPVVNYSLKRHEALMMYQKAVKT